MFGVYRYPYRFYFFVFSQIGKINYVFYCYILNIDLPATVHKMKDQWEMWHNIPGMCVGHGMA